MGPTSLYVILAGRYCDGMKTAAKGVGGRQTRAKSRRLFRSKLPENMETAGDGGGGGSGGGGEEELDGLEIVSVGALYKDPWAKKYWSCSRVWPTLPTLFSSSINDEFIA